MDYGRLLHQLPDELRTFIRKYEALSKKLINNKWSTKFNEICLEEDILPNFTRIRHHDPAVGKTRTTLKYRRYLLEREIEQKKKHAIELKNQKEECFTNINSFTYNFIYL